MDRILLTIEEVLEAHQDQIRRHGGSLGVRDMGLLESAINAAVATFGGQFLHDDIFDMAAAYLFYIVKNHAFIDGNKRAGATAALVFLDLNGFDLPEDEPAFSELVLNVAQDRIGKEQVAGYFRARAVPRSIK